ncbi:MAG TPA: hypothetical protein VN829_22295, partial [Dongiaceae bacterium]|nr:hypothetical protein [Dongiaceae bacterium]
MVLWSVVCGLWSADAQTPVLFSTYNFTGQVLNNPITVTPLDSLISDSQNLYAAGSAGITLQPVAGIAATNLMPGDYRVVIQGVGRAWTITVPATTNLQNAAAIPKLGVESQNIFFWTNSLAGVTLNLSFTNAQDQFAGTWIGNGGSLAVSTNEGFRVFPAWAPFPAPGFFFGAVGLDDWGPSSLNDLGGDTVLMAGTNNVVVIRDSAGTDLAYFSSTNGGTPKLSMAASGTISASSLPATLQSLATNNALALTNVAALSIPNEIYVNTTNGSDANSGLNWSCAKATLLGAYDALSTNGGTIHFADGSWVGSNSGQGLWLMGPNDPNWGQTGFPGTGRPIGANGWRARKGMTRWVGHGGTQSSQWGFPAIANLLAGGGGPWLTNMSAPALWFSDCSLGIAFENVLIANCPHPLRIGPDSTMAGATFCSQYWFLNCTLGCNSGATDDRVSGPTVWMESGQQTHFQNCNLGSYTTADGSLIITNNRHATVLCNIIPNALYGAGGFKIVDSSFFGGGIRYFVPESGDGGFQLDNDILECGNYAACPPMAWIIGLSYYLAPMTIRNCVMWDGYFYPGLALVQVDTPNGFVGSPSDTVFTDTLLVNGPATILNNNIGFSGVPINQPSVQHQAGIAQNRFWGMTDAFRRNFSPAAVVVTNQVPVGLPASCTNAPDPAGATNAFASTTVGAGALSIRLATVPYAGLSAGDFYVFGAWVKLSGTNQLYGDAGALFLSSLDGTM